MNKITENEIEDFAVELLEKQGYNYIYAPYIAPASDLKKALSFYSDSGGKDDLALAQELAVSLMLEKVEVVSQIYHGFAYEKRTLRQFGYPPDMQKLATETVLKQAEMIASELAA